MINAKNESEKNYEKSCEALSIFCNMHKRWAYTNGLALGIFCDEFGFYTAEFSFDDKNVELKLFPTGVIIENPHRNSVFSLIKKLESNTKNLSIRMIDLEGNSNSIVYFYATLSYINAPLQSDDFDDILNQNIAFASVFSEEIRKFGIGIIPQMDQIVKSLISKYETSKRINIDNCKSNIEEQINALEKRIFGNRNNDFAFEIEDDLFSSIPDEMLEKKEPLFTAFKESQKKINYDGESDTKDG